jgi:hypothetical protein
MDDNQWCQHDIMGAIILELHSSWNELFLLSCNWIAMNCTVYTWIVTHATCSLALTTYKYSELQMNPTTQKLNYKANCKTPLFFIVNMK